MLTGLKDLYNLGYRTLCLKNDKHQPINDFISMLAFLYKSPRHSNNLAQSLLTDTSKVLYKLLEEAQKVGFKIVFIDPQPHQEFINSQHKAKTREEARKILDKQLAFRDNEMAKDISSYSKQDDGGVISILGFLHGSIQKELECLLPNQPLYICLKGSDSELAKAYHGNKEALIRSSEGIEEYFEKLSTPEFQKKHYPCGIHLVEGEVSTQEKKEKFFDNLLDMVTVSLGSYAAALIESPMVCKYLNVITGKMFIPKVRGGAAGVVDALLKISDDIADPAHYTQYMNKKFGLPFKHQVINDQSYLVLHSINKPTVAQQLWLKYSSLTAGSLVK